MKHEIWCPLEDMKKEGLWYSVVVRDRHGKVVSRERRKSHSFLKQWNQLVYVQMRNIACANIIDTGGVARDPTAINYNFRANTPIGSIATGIIVGTGNTAPAIDDFVIETLIPQGVGAGLMEYQASTTAQPIVTATGCSYIHSRSIINNSGGVITVREATIYVAGFDSPSVRYFCVIRDVLTAPQAVPDGGGITIDWSIGVIV